MTNELYFKPKRRSVMDLQLTAMVDIFSMLIIFLIKGTVFAVSDIVVPSDIQLPKSYSKEELEATPQVLVYNEHIEFRFLNDQKTSWADLQNFSGTLRAKAEELKTNLKKKDLMVSLVADKKTPYKKIFDLSKVLKESGFESVLFLANSNEAAGQ